MYERYWKFSKKPFENDQDTSLIFYAKDHKEALLRLLYTVSESKGLMLLTGDTGCGKTFLCHTIRKELETQSFVVSLVSNPADDPVELLKQIAFELGVSPVPNGKSELLACLRAALGELVASDSRTVLIIDNAETIDNDKVLEEIRLLLDLENQGRSLLTVILSGHTRLRAALKRFPSLFQRVALQFHVPAFTESEARSYIEHRLQAAGGNSRIFNPRAISEIFGASRGVPRLINNICDLSLLLAFSARRGQIDGSTVNQAREEFSELAGS